MHKICISGQAGSGKDTFTKLLIAELGLSDSQYISSFFAKKIKETISDWFPGCNPEGLYGNSEMRQTMISSRLPLLKNSISFRDACILLGKWGRSIDPSFWISHLELEFSEARARDLSFFITDQRFVDEFEWAKSNGFYLIRVKRDACLKLSDISETCQSEIPDESYNSIVDNNGSLNDLKNEAQRIAKVLL